MSWNVIFEKESGHCTISILYDNDLELLVPVPANPAAHPIPVPRQQITPCIRDSDKPLHSNNSGSNKLSLVLQHSTQMVCLSHMILDAGCLQSTVCIDHSICIPHIDQAQQYKCSTTKLLESHKKTKLMGTSNRHQAGCYGGKGGMKNYQCKEHIKWEENCGLYVGIC